MITILRSSVVHGEARITVISFVGSALSRVLQNITVCRIPKLTPGVGRWKRKISPESAVQILFNTEPHDLSYFRGTLG